MPHFTLLELPSRLSLAGFFLACVVISAALQAEGAQPDKKAPLENPAALPWLIVQPGYPGTNADAAGFVRDFRAYLKKHSGLEWAQGAYHNVPEAAIKAVQAAQPKVALVSLGFYLRHRERFGLTALAESQPAERLAIVVREDYQGTPRALAGKVAGGPLYEPVFLERIAFPMLPVATWKPLPTLRPSRALRFLSRGRYEAVVLNGRELRGFREVLKMRQLKSIAQSPAFPPALLVTFGRQRKLAKGASSGVHRISPESSKKIVAAFLKMGSTQDGRELLNTMGAKGFREVRQEWLKRLEGIYDAGKEKKREETPAGDGRGD